jgi:hypothetical protein
LQVHLYPTQVFTVLQALNAAQLLLYIGLLALVGQGLLFVLAGQKRDTNLIYQLFQVLNRPWLYLARLISPARVDPRHHGWVAFFVTSVLYIAVTLAKIEHCVSAGMEMCR